MLSAEDKEILCVLCALRLKYSRKLLHSKKINENCIYADIVNHL